MMSWIRYAFMALVLIRDRAQKAYVRHQWKKSDVTATIAISATIIDTSRPV
jgi:hypothetical protein